MRLFVEVIILECRQKHITKVGRMGFEFEMGLFPNVLGEANAKGIDIPPKYIPTEVFDKRAAQDENRDGEAPAEPRTVKTSKLNRRLIDRRLKPRCWRCGL